MIKDLQVTLYEVFGYVLPGTVVLASLHLFYWMLFFPAPAVSFDLRTTEVWLAFLILSYFAGHMGQAIGNLVQKNWASPEKLVLGPKGELSETLLKACKEKASKSYGIDAATLDEVSLFRLCDDAVLRSGKLGEREIFQYREGFYRGTAIGFAMLAIACLSFASRLWFVEGRALHVAGADWELTLWEFVAAAVVSAGFARLAWQRFRRFGSYRVSQAMYGFLTIQEAGKSEAKGESENTGASVAVTPR